MLTLITNIIELYYKSDTIIRCFVNQRVEEICSSFVINGTMATLTYTHFF